MMPNLRALVVEDDDAIREAMTEFLESTGCQVTAVGSAELGLAALECERFGLLVTDYALPGECGAWLVRRAREQRLLSDTAVVMVTARLHPPQIPEVLVLRKPLDLDRLVDEVSRCHQRCAPGRDDLDVRATDPDTATAAMEASGLDSASRRADARSLLA